MRSSEFVPFEDDAKQIADFKLKTDIDVIGTIPYYFYGTVKRKKIMEKKYGDWF